MSPPFGLHTESEIGLVNLKSQQSLVPWDSVLNALHVFSRHMQTRQ